MGTFLRLIRQIPRNMFGLDWRSLALFRMALAGVILADLAICVQSLRTFYTDDGVLPRWVLLEYNPPLVSIHIASGSVWYEAALFAIEAALAVMLLVGYHTRVAQVACWFMVISRQARNTLILFGPDMLLHIILFWAMFLPLNRRFSVDAVQGRVQPPTGKTYLGIPGFAYIVQFVIAYVMSGTLKTGETWQDGTAVYYALSLEMYQRPLGAWLNQFDGLTRWMTFSTVYLELFGPLLFILPFFSGWGRLLGFTLFAGLQVGFGVCLQMGLFGWVMTAMMLPFLPDEFWRYCVAPIARRLPEWASANEFWRESEASEFRQAATARRTVWSDWQHRLSFLLRLARDGVVLAALVFAVLWNLDTLPDPPSAEPAITSDGGEQNVDGSEGQGDAVAEPPKPARTYFVQDRYYWLGKLTGLVQSFDMFSPNPQRNDGWFVLRGQMHNGQSINILSGDSPATLEKPANVAETYSDERWFAGLFSLMYDWGWPYLQPYAYSLGREWNRTHSEEQQLKSLEIIFLWEGTGPNHTKEPIEEMLLWTEAF